MICVETHHVPKQAHFLRFVPNFQSETTCFHWLADNISHMTAHVMLRYPNKEMHSVEHKRYEYERCETP